MQQSPIAKKLHLDRFFVFGFSEQLPEGAMGGMTQV